MTLDTARTTGLAETTDIAQAGIVFDDATRLLDGGLWKASPAADNNPGDGEAPYLGMYTTDLHAVLSDITADLAPGAAVTVNGAAYTLTPTDVSTLTTIQGQLGQLITDAPGSVGFGAGAIAAQSSMHQTHLDIIHEIQADTGLAGLINNASVASGTGFNEVGFQALPTGSDSAAALTAAEAPGATLQTIGQVFNQANEVAVGGLNSSNIHEFNTDMQAIETGINNILNNPTELSALEATATSAAVTADATATGNTVAPSALTAIHLETVAEQIELQMTDFDSQVSNHVATAARSINDNMLDIIDIVQNDPVLQVAAGGTTGGFGELPGYNHGTIVPYQDNQAQTNFWSEFIAGGNQINNALNAIATGAATEADGVTPTPTIAALEVTINQYEALGQSFDSQQGGVFGARFDNELKGGTLEVDSANALSALQVLANPGAATAAQIAAAQAQAQAAGTGFIADAADVSGNNIPLGGGTYVGTSTTVAGATSASGVATTTTITQNPTTGGPDNATVTAAYVAGQQTPILGAGSNGHHHHDDGLINSQISMGGNSHGHDDFGIMNGGQNNWGAGNYGSQSPAGGSSDQHDVPVVQDHHHHETQVASNDWMFHHH
jgi:hypothetical protein